MRVSDTARGRLMARAAGCIRTPALLPVLLVLAAALLRPVSAHAQTGVVLAGHLGSSAAAPGGVMLDFGTEVRQGVFGVRVGVGLDAAGTPLAPVVTTAETSSGVWTSDLDAGLNVARIPYVGGLFARSDPTVFLGMGIAGVSTTGSEGARSSTVVPTWSYGARAGVPVISWLRFEAEARNRLTFGAAASEAYPVGQGWDYRLGLALRFGSRPAARTVAAPSRAGAARPRPVGRDTRRHASAEEVADRTIETGERYLGTPYRWGGASPAGFDCSGFVQFVFREQGIALPRVSRDQAHAGHPVSTGLNGLARGDLLFFAQNGSTVDHVAIYAGDGRILHSSSSGSGVRYDDLSGNRGRWYVQHLVAVRRVIGWETMLRFGAGAEGGRPEPSRSLPLDQAFEAITGEPGDRGAPAE